MDVNCTLCGAKIAEYSGPTGAKTPIESKYYTRIDGSQPAHGSSTTGKCPTCEQEINELECVLFAVTKNLDPPDTKALLDALGG